MIDERSENLTETGLSRALGSWVGGVRRRSGAVMIGFGASTLALLAYTALSLDINASHMALLSEDLEFWRQYKAFADAFPIVDETLFVVVDADSSLRAKKATDLLASNLESSGMFTSVYVPGGGPYFEKNALLYLTVADLEDITDNLASVQPLLAALLTGAVAAATGISFNFVNVVVLPLLLGIGIDSGIHLVHRYRVSAGEHNRIAGDDLLGTSTAQAVFFSALTTMASFGTLALSGHAGISSMGQLLLIGVLLMLVCNLVVLPALISRRLRTKV